MAAFTTIALGVGAAAALGGSIGSFTQANKAKKQQRQAEIAANRAIERARREMNVNYYDELAIAKRPYELESEQLRQQSADALQRFAEGDQRGLGAGVGRVQAGMIDSVQAQRAAMEQDIRRIEEKRLGQDINLQNQRIGLDQMEATGAQLAAREAEYRRQQAIQQGVGGLADAAMTTAFMATPLYKKQEAPSAPAVSNSPMSPFAGQAARLSLASMGPFNPYAALTSPSALSAGSTSAAMQAGQYALLGMGGLNPFFGRFP